MENTTPPISPCLGGRDRRLGGREKEEEELCLFLAGRAQFTAGKKLSVVYFPRSTLHLTGSLFSRRTDYFVFNEPALGAKLLDGFNWNQEHM